MIIRIICIFLCASTSLLAQKFTTHAVQKGETLYSVATKYGVSTESLLKYNKEIKAGAGLPLNTILVVPQSKEEVAAVAPSPRKSTVVKTKDTIVDRELLGFATHEVQKRETLYGIAKKYDITEEQIKKHNPNLYSSELKRKMEIRIPKYKNIIETVTTLDPNAFEDYAVAAKETRWSIAHKFGISVDSMLVLNPNLSTKTNSLSIGQVLVMPKMAGSTVSNQKTQLYTSYTVPPKMNFYQLEKKFGVSADEIVRLNPEITTRGGLKEAMVLRIPENKPDLGVVNTDNYIFYEVKPKQTEFRLTRKFGVTWTELVQLNPDLKSGLKAGMVLKLPKNQVGDFEVKNSLVLDKINLADSINRRNQPQVMFLLPFRLDKLDLADAEGTSWVIQNRNSLKYSLALYSGALIAADSLASLGVSVTVKTMDNQLSLAKTKSLLLGENIGEYDAIFGPLDEDSLKEVAIQAAAYDVPVIAPVKAKSNLSLSNVFFSATDDSLLSEHMVAYVKKNYTDENIVVIADDKSAAAKELLIQEFPDAQVLEVKEEQKNIGINREKLAALLHAEQENWIFLESQNFKLIASVVSILNAYNNTIKNPVDEDGEPIPNAKKLKLRLFTTDRNSAFENDVISSTRLSNLNFTYPSTYREMGSNSFVAMYRKKFGEAPDKYAVRGFDVAYDVLLKLAYKNNLIDASKLIGSTEYVGAKFNYTKDATSGYFNQASYIMAYEDMHIKQLE